MFDFEKLEVYQKAKIFNKDILSYISEQDKLNRTTKDQLQRASLSIMLNIAEGSSRFSKADRKNFFVIARGSAFECAAIFDFLNDSTLIQKDLFDKMNGKLEELSKMLFAMIKNLQI